MIAIKTNLDKMPKTCKDCRLKAVSFSHIELHYSGILFANKKPEIEGITCFNGMSVLSNALDGTRNANCPLVELYDGWVWEKPR